VVDGAFQKHFLIENIFLFLILAHQYHTKNLKIINFMYFHIKNNLKSILKIRMGYRNKPSLKQNQTFLTI
jgi:hypothetical protein